MASAVGAMHAAVNVERSANVGGVPGTALASFKCWVSLACSAAARGSDGGRPAMRLTNSLIAVVGWVLDQRFAPAGGVASMSSAPMLLQRFSMPARKNRVGSLGSTGATAPRLYPSLGS